VSRCALLFVNPPRAALIHSSSTPLTSPGRFFASHVLKLMVAYIVMNYDVEPIPVRPLNSELVGSVVPSRTATLKVRRRKGTC
jgi:hypothetical protein